MNRMSKYELKLWLSSRPAEDKRAMLTLLGMVIEEADAVARTQAQARNLAEMETAVQAGAAYYRLRYAVCELGGWEHPPLPTTVIYQGPENETY